MRKKKFWEDFWGAILFAFASLAGLVLFIAQMVSLISPLHWLVWVTLGLAGIIGLIVVSTSSRRELNAFKDIQERHRLLSLYDGIRPRPYYFPWSEQEHRLGVSGVNTLRLGIRLDNMGDTTVSSCSLTIKQCCYRNALNLYGYVGDERVPDPVGTQEFPLKPETPMQENPERVDIAPRGGSAIFNLASRGINPSEHGFRYVFSKQLSLPRSMDGIYSVRIQLEATVRQNELETQLIPKQFLAVFWHRFHRITGLRIVELPRELNNDKQND